jgi:DNA ligase (NAD+)
LGRIVFALGIRHVGSETAEILANEFRTIDDLANATIEKLTDISTIGPRIAESIVAFFQQDDNQDILRRLKNAEVFPDAQETPKAVDSPISGREFVLTGRLDSLSRPEAEAKIKELGGTARGNVTRKTDYVVAGADPGSKRDRAVELGIPVIDEKKLLEMLESKK